MKNSILIRPVLCQLVLKCIIKTRHKCIHSAVFKHRQCLHAMGINGACIGYFGKRDIKEFWDMGYWNLFWDMS